DRKPGADGIVAEKQPAPVLRSGSASRTDPSRSYHRTDDQSLSEAPPGQRAGDLSTSIARAGVEANLGRSTVSGAAAADGHDLRQLHRRRSRGAASRARS